MRSVGVNSTPGSTRLGDGRRVVPPWRRLVDHLDAQDQTVAELDLLPEGRDSRSMCAPRERAWLDQRVSRAPSGLTLASSIATVKLSKPAASSEISSPSPS